jgi:2-keto-3-deoxy-L-rhamnonate aldolase RhmA
MGIDALIIPMITSVQEAKDALELCLYPPKGQRGFGPRRAIAYNAQDLDQYLSESEASFLRIIQIEHIEAVKVIDEILSLDALDAIIIGPNDLAASVGLLGKSLHPKVLELGAQIIEAAKKAHKPVGVSIGPTEEGIKAWQDLGVDFISVGDDISFVQMGALQTFAMIEGKSI